VSYYYVQKLRKITWVSKEIAAKVLRETAEVLKEIIERAFILLKNRSLELQC